MKREATIQFATMIHEAMLRAETVVATAKELQALTETSATLETIQTTFRPGQLLQMITAI